MAKSQVIDSLLTSATRLFAAHGFEGASLREIAADAGVPLSSIHTYFGSKQCLYEEICLKAWADLSKERDALLAKSMAEAPDGVVPLAEIIRALAYPVVRRAVGGSKLDRDVVAIMREANAYRVIHDPSRRRQDDEPRLVWLRSIWRTCPEFPWPGVVWIYSYIIGAIYSWHLTDGLYQDLRDLALDGPVQESGDSVEALTRGLIDFCTAGVEALYQGRIMRTYPKGQFQAPMPPAIAPLLPSQCA